MEIETSKNEANAIIINALDLEVAALSRVLGDHIQEDAEFKAEAISKYDELSALISKLSERLDRKQCHCNKERPLAIGHHF